MITLTAIENLLHDLWDVRRVLVIAPLRVAQSTWVQEAAKWPHLRQLRFAQALGSASERRAAVAAGAEITIINRENVPWLVREYGRRWPFDMIVIDELSSFRNPSAQRFKALRKIRPKLKRVVGLTGTPAPKGLIDLWSQIYLLDQGERLGSTVTGYRNRWFSPGRRNGHVVFEWIPRAGSDIDIYGRISDICMSMQAADYLNMPDCLRIVEEVDLPDTVMQQYRDFECELVLQLANQDPLVAQTRGVLAGKLQQVANGAVYLDPPAEGEFETLHDAKLDRLEDLIEAANGRPVLVYYAYRHDLVRLMQRFPQAVPIGGPDVIAQWNAGEIPVMLAHPASAGHGLNLQAGGSIMVWFGMTWDLELYQQANARLLRQGQQDTVRIYHIVARGTRDMDCLPVLNGRAVNQQDLMDALRARAG